MKGLCSSCGKQRDRYGQRACKACHARLERERRGKIGEKRSTISRESDATSGLTLGAIARRMGAGRAA
jgi:hypothetical protein